MTPDPGMEDDSTVVIRTYRNTSRYNGKGKEEDLWRH